VSGGGRLVAAALCAALTAFAAGAAPATFPQPSESGLGADTRDVSVRPGDDFFSYALGGWYARTTIAADQGEAGVDAETGERVRGQLRELIEASAQRPANPSETRVGALYRSFMDEKRVEALDARPLHADLQAIRAASTKADFARLMARSYAGFGASMFSLVVSPDARLPVNALVLGQDGLGMADRDNYLKPDFQAQKREYELYVARALTMVGYAQPQAAAHAVVAFETRLAELSWSQDQRRDVQATYNPMTITALQAFAPGLSWRRFMDDAGAGRTQRVVVAEASAVRDLAKLYGETPLETLKAWETFHTVDGASAFLSSRFVNSRFAYRGMEMSGAMTIRPRWSRGVSLVDADLGEALGHAYVTRHFSPRAKAEVSAMVSNVKLAMASRIEAAGWMSASTKREAQRKLARMAVLVGYPDVWRDYAGLRIDPRDLYGNVQRSTAFDWSFQMARIGKPIAPTEWGPFFWGIRPQTVDAFNIALENKIIFPAAILQPPYFKPDGDPARNYGALGGVIGHEITHGFDDQGRKIDGDGRLRDWWTPADAARFTAEADKVVTQYERFEVLPGVRLNGRQVLGENIADLGGLLLAFDAYHASLHGTPAPVVDGLTGDQRVFLGWASRWRRKQRDDALRQQVASDVHAPARLRVNGPVRNIDDWYAAFGVKPTDQLYLAPQDRARIW